ncbi:fatty acid cis/trans isomerase [Pseudomonas segetis]
MQYRSFISACFALASPLLAAEQISYSKDIQPIFTKNCVACHACYDAPCQLKLESGEGAERGASQSPVYDGSRKKAQDPTRLFYDAHTVTEWRNKGFNSVLDQQGSQAALMSRMLKLGHDNNSFAPNSKLPEKLDLGINRVNQCTLPGDFDKFAAKNPAVGMPFAVTGLTAEDYQTLQRWLASGAPVDKSVPVATPAEIAQVQEWEAFFNQHGAREELVSRWLYEHLFLAHLYFDDGKTRHFFQLVRSRTPSGKPIDPIATRRPNEDPGTDFYYRIAMVPDVIVHKTHITYALSRKKMAHIKSMFLDSSWTADAIPGYGAQRRANPFETYKAIPAEARYQFMLDDAEYFVRTFIRGPVCRGQIATDVIRDNFWTFFQDPKHDLYITDPEYRAEATPLLAMPGQFDDIGSLVGMWDDYHDKRNEYEELRRDRYEDAPLPSWSNIWSGNDQSLLSIFRQFDSATVRRGLIGGIPQTIWWMDYPLLERTYYQLVVNFDVFGNVSHQAQTRLYFDLIRNGAEQNFLRLMPADSREGLLKDWYRNSGRLKLWFNYYEGIDTDTKTALSLDPKHPKRNFAEQLLMRSGDLNVAPDPINRCLDGHCYQASSDSQMQHAEQALSRLVNKPAAGLKVIHQLPEATMLRVEEPGGKRNIYSILRNRMHSNVAFIAGEGLRYEPGLDTLTIYPGIMSSYPNFIFNVPAQEVPDFVSALEQAKDAGAFEKVVDHWGVRRTHPDFWRYFHDLTRYIEETDPVQAGVLDMNRYENL